MTVDRQYTRQDSTDLAYLDESRKTSSDVSTIPCTRGSPSKGDARGLKPNTFEYLLEQRGDMAQRRSDYTIIIRARWGVTKGLGKDHLPRGMMRIGGRCRRIISGNKAGNRSHDYYPDDHEHSVQDIFLSITHLVVPRNRG